MFANRELQISDTEIIASFPGSEKELFYMFPRAAYPLNPEFLYQESQLRFYPTVVTYNTEIAGYGNFINAENSNFCTMGNIVVNPQLRGIGVASYLIAVLESVAFKTLEAKYIKVSCFNENTAGLLLYRKLGYLPFEAEQRQSYDEKNVVLIHMRKYFE